MKTFIKIFMLIIISLIYFSCAVKTEKTRVLLDTDANNELDDQHAIAYMLFSGNDFDVEGMTVNKTKNGGDVEQHFKEAERIVKLCNLYPEIKVYKGANGSFDEIKDKISETNFDGSNAVNFIIAKAKEKSDRKLVLLPIGKLTNIALALLKDSSIASKVRIVWLGSNYPDPGEYNQDNDIPALNYILDVNVDFEIALVRYGKPSGTDAVRVYLSDIEEKMPGKGPHISNPVIGRHGGTFTNFGDYSVSLFKNIDLDGEHPSRALFDMAAVAIVKNPSWAISSQIPSPIFINSKWIDRPKNHHKITIWQNFNKEKIIWDFFYCINNYALVRK